MKLDVPLVKQPPESSECGIAAVAMLLNYHNNQKTVHGKKRQRDAITLEQLRKDIPQRKNATYMAQLGIYLLKLGFAVTIVTQNPALFTLRDRKRDQKQIKEKLVAIQSSADKEYQFVFDFFAQFIDAGGNIELAVPNAHHIRQQIKRRQPLFALMTTNFLKGKKTRFNGHYNVITGIDSKYIYVNDPLPDYRGGKQKHLIENFIYGIHASAGRGYDNASLLIVEPKK